MDLSKDSLLPGERVLWSGRPQRAVLRGADWYRLAFGLVWTSLTVGITLSGGRFAIFGTIFLLFGLSVSCGPVIARHWILRRAAYAVTDRRIVVTDYVSGRIRTSAYLKAMPPPLTRVGRHGIGTVSFGERAAPFTGFMTGRSPSTLLTLELIAVPEAERVCALIAQAQIQAAG